MCRKSVRIMQFAPRRLVLVWCLLWGLAAPTSALAAFAPRWSVAELTEFSDVVLTGNVVSAVPGTDGSGAIYTYVTIAVDDVLKGPVVTPPSQVIVKQLGGTIGTLMQVVWGQALFTPGEEVLVFLEVRPRDSTLYTAAHWQGKWVIQRNAFSGNALAAPLLPAAPGLTVVRQQVTAGGEARALDALLDEIRSATRQTLTFVPLPRPRMVFDPPDAPDPADLPEVGPIDPAPFVVWGYRWHEADAGTPVPVDVQTGGQDGLPDGGFAEIFTGRGLWNGVGTSMTLSSGIRRSGRCHGTYEGDDHITVTFMDPCGEMSNSGGTLAIGGGWIDSSDTRTVNGTVFKKWSQGGIVFNDSSTALGYAQDPICFTEVLTHELGHTLGLSHSSDSDAIMYAYADSTCFSRSTARALHADDVAGIEFIYPGGSGVPPAPSPPSNLTASVSESAVTLQWLPPTHGDALTSYIVEVGSASGASDLLAVNTESAAPTLVLTSVAAGTYHGRVRAVTSAGAGAPSNDVTFSIGGGAAPPPAPAPPETPTPEPVPEPTPEPPAPE
jgi:hypothetical protein